MLATMSLFVITHKFTMDVKKYTMILLDYKPKFAVTNS